MDRSKMLHELQRALSTNTLVPFIGAGVSMSAGAPSWRGYLEQIREMLPEDDPFRSLRIDSSDAYLDIADVLIHQLKLHGQTPPGVNIDGASALHRELAA